MDRWSIWPALRDDASQHWARPNVAISTNWVLNCGVWAYQPPIPTWVEKNPWTTLVSLCLSIGQYRLFPLRVLAALARKSRLVRTIVVCEVHSASSQLQLESRNSSVQV